MPLSMFSHLPHYCYRQGGSGGSCLLPLSIMFNLLPHLCCRKGDQEAHVLCHLQYSVIYHTFALGRGVQGSHGLCHFQYCFSHLPLLSYRQGVQEAHVFCHFFNNVSVLYHTCVVVRAFRRLMCYATYNIQSFTTPLL
jgi:hypothetical protein